MGVFERFTDRARRVMVLAQEEARRLGHNFIGTEHLLIGLITEGEGIGARALASLGLNDTSIRAAVEEKVAPSSEFTPTGSPPFTPVAKKALELALRETLQLGHNYIGTEHILLGILRTDDAVALSVLEELGADTATVRATVISLLRLEPGTHPLPAPGSARRLLRRMPLRQGPRPQPPTQTRRQFDVIGPIDVALSNGRLTGVVAGTPVDVTVDLPTSSGTCDGSFAGADVRGTWRLAPNGQWVPDVPGWARGIFGGEEGELRGWFRLSEDCLFEHGTIEGEFAGEPVSVLVEAGIASKPEDAFKIQGSFCGSGFSLSCTFATEATRIIGSVDGNPIHLEARRPQPGVEPRLRTVTGNFEGPSPLLYLAVCALLFFI